MDKEQILSILNSKQESFRIGKVLYSKDADSGMWFAWEGPQISSDCDENIWGLNFE